MGDRESGTSRPRSHSVPSPKKKRIKRGPLSPSEKQTVINMFKFVEETWPKDTYRYRTDLVKKTGQELKKKWNNCRDYYKKNKQKRGRRSRYVYADILSFLDKVDKKNHEENDDTDDYLELEVLETTEDDDDEEWETQKAVEDIKNEYKHKNTNRESSPKKRKLQHVPAEISNVTTSKNYTASKDYDDDKNFLLSFSSDMKKMTHRQKIEFKLAMMQLLKDTFTENANSPPYYIESSEPPKLIYSDPMAYQEDANSSSAQSRFRRTPSTDQRHSKLRKHQKYDIKQDV